MRRELAQAQSVPAYVVFHDATLRELARLRPTTESELRGITRVYRQTNATLQARAVLDDSEFTSQAIEADLRPISFGAADAGVGLVTRFQGEHNFYDAWLRANGRVSRDDGDGLRDLPRGVWSRLRAAELGKGCECVAGR